MNKNILKDKRLRAVVLDSKTGCPLSGITIVAIAETKGGQQFTIGILASDHAGFVSFDLEHLDTTLDEIVYVGVSRMGDEARADNVIDQLAVDSSEIPVLIDSLPYDPHIPRPQLPSIQGFEPGKCFVSPNSFFTNPSARLGEGGCEILLPSNSATHELRFRQVVVTKGERKTIDMRETPSGDTRNEFRVVTLRRGYVFEYKVTWYPLGHSLGRLLYSLPLAPCESVNLAIIDWSRRDEAMRREETTFSERLVHSQRRDRMIEETVKASLEEWQGGGSFMAGIAGSGSIGILSLSAAAGGGYSTSGGERDLAANVVQRLSDNIAQTSSAVRNLRSTVVTQVSQEEREAIETRTVTNHNHCHAMTVLYYEVLRHYRVVTECVSKWKVLFVDHIVGKKFDVENALCHRLILERVLLDPRLHTCFEALAKMQCAGVVFKESGEAEAEDDTIHTLQAVIRTGGDVGDGTDGDVYISLIKMDGTEIKCEFTDPSGDDDKYVLDHENYDDFQSGDSDTYGLRPDVDPLPRLSDLRHFKIGQKRGGNWRLKSLKLEAFGAFREGILFDDEVDSLIPDEGAIVLPVRHRDLPSGYEIPEEMLSMEERCCVTNLLAHLNCHRPYYWNAIWMLEDPNERVYRFRNDENYNQVPLLNYIENHPVGSVGDDIAFPELGSSPEPVLDDDGNPVDPETECVALPVHGVFAEAQLGSCNACEKRDITRFWDWSESPCPEKAPEIAPITAGSRAQDPDLEPSTMPGPIVNIMNPPAAPDPTGLAAAFSLLATPEIFRDMSGRQEVSDLLQSLADGTISLEQARRKATQIKDRQQSSDLKGLTPEEQHDQRMVTESSPHLTEEEKAERERETVQPRRLGNQSTNNEERADPEVRPDLRTIEIRLRAFVRPEIWEPSLGIPVFGLAQAALLAIRFNGDNRFFSSDPDASSRVDLPVRLQLDANDMSIVSFDDGIGGEFGVAEVYLATDTENVPGMPEWAESLNVGAQPFMRGRLERTPENLRSMVSKQGDSVVVRLQVEAQPYFPFSEEVLDNLPDFDVNVEVGSFDGKAVLRSFLSLTLPSIDADFGILFAKRDDGELQFAVSGMHDGFPAWELYVNGVEACIPHDPDTDDAPRLLFHPIDQRAVAATIPVTRID